MRTAQILSCPFAGYILFLIIVVSLLGLGMEAILVHGLIKKKYDNFR